MVVSSTSSASSASPSIFSSSKLQICPKMIETLTPFVYWAQTENQITLKVALNDVKVNDFISHLISCKTKNSKCRELVNLYLKNIRSITTIIFFMGFNDKRN